MGFISRPGIFVICFGSPPVVGTVQISYVPALADLNASVVPSGETSNSSIHTVCESASIGRPTRVFGVRPPAGQGRMTTKTTPAAITMESKPSPKRFMTVPPNQQIRKRSCRDNTVMLLTGPAVGRPTKLIRYNKIGCSQGSICRVSSRTGHDAQGEIPCQAKSSSLRCLIFVVNNLASRVNDLRRYRVSIFSFNPDSRFCVCVSDV